MNTLQRIAQVFENVKHALKNKNSPECMHGLKHDILTLRTELQVLQKENNGMFIRALAMEGYLALLSAKTLPISPTEKFNVLNSLFEKLKPFALKEEVLFVFLRIQNLLCYYLIQLEKTDMCREILESIEELYENINKTNPSNFIDAEDLFTVEPLVNIKRVSPEKIDKVITNNIQMQAFLYNKMNLPEKYVLYNHTALRRQLEMKEGTPQEWALRAARLGNYYTHLNQLGNARHHLCAAYHVLRTCHDRCKLVPTDFVLQKTDFEMHFLELSHHFVKYGLTLFKLSKKKILNRYFNQSSAPTGIDLWKTIDMAEDNEGCESKFDDENLKDAGAENNAKYDYVSGKVFPFPTLNLKEMETKVPVDLVREVDEARRLFMFTHKWLMRAKRYYSFELQPAQYTSCALQMAELYEHLAFFERNVDNQYSIQKRRAYVLESLNSLLKSCDTMMSVQIDVIRELSQVQLELMALNLQKLWCEESQTNFFNVDNDMESMMSSLASSSNRTLTKPASVTSKNMFLKKMEAATAISGRLFRLSGTLIPDTPSQLSFTK